jgi:CMP-N-acetylneuraminic acid synthetase
MKDQKILAVIPARGGSKGIPRKNLQMLLGKPLIAYSIHAALQARTIRKTVVSTDDESIAHLARQYGAEVPFVRPPHLSTDTATSVSVVQHAVRHLSNTKEYWADIIVCLQPTSPLRSAQDIDQAVTLCVRTGADSVVSLCRADHHPYWMKKVVGNRVYPLMEVDDEQYPRRQDLPPAYQLNGAVYVTRRHILLEQERLLGANTLAYIMPRERSVDIDTPIDLKLAELMMMGESAS